MNLLQFSKSIADIGSSPASKYRCWFSENAVQFDKINRSESEKLAVKLDAVPKQCYTNCTMAVIRYSEYEYYEGYVDCFGVPIDHAFLVRDNEVIDPTLGIPNSIRQQHAKEKYGIDLKNDKSRFGNCYLGVKISREDVMRLSLRDNTYSLTSFEYWLQTHGDKIQ